VKGEARAHVLAERRLLQTGRTGPRGQFIANKWVTLVRRRISPEFIVYYSAVPRNDIGPCLLVVALMSLIAPPVRNRTAASHSAERHGSRQTLKRVPRFPPPPSPSPSPRSFSFAVRIKEAAARGDRNSASRFSSYFNLQLIGTARNRIPAEENGHREGEGGREGGREAREREREMQKNGDRY